MKKILRILFLLLLLIDLAYSFNQYYHTPLGGDLAEITVPLPNTGYYDVLQNPFGLGETHYPNPNRFFAHYLTQQYFLAVPIALQTFFEPIKSVYLSSALAKLFIHLFLLYLLAFFISGKKNPFHFQFLLAALLLTPLFQTNGYNRYMGIVDKAVVYSFFYALPLAFLCLFFIPFFRHLQSQKKLIFSWGQRILLLLFLVFLCLNGPLVPGVILIVCPSVLLYQWFKNYTATFSGSFFTAHVTAVQNINKDLLFFFVTACLLSLYSLYLGSFNSLNSPSELGLLSRYADLPKGLYHLLVRKAGYLFLLGSLLVNALLLKRTNTSESKKTLQWYKWIAVFSIIYLLLLPLGGFRDYRPNTIRYDTFMPVTIALVALFGKSTLCLLHFFSRSKKKVIYSLFIILIVVAFTNADRLETDDYLCEKKLMIELAEAAENPAVLSSECTLMEWNIFKKPKQSKLNSRLFYYWNITKEKKRYYQK